MLVLLYSNFFVSVHDIHVWKQQRLLPGLSSSQNYATAHYSVVTGLRTTTDGMYLLSSGNEVSEFEL
jgi:hypothetical protein